MNLLVGLAGAPLPVDEDQLNTPPTNTDHRRKKKRQNPQPNTINCFTFCHCETSLPQFTFCHCEP